jgi:glycosyltransferase involved in cell wall biosynthesis
MIEHPRPFCIRRYSLLVQPLRGTITQYHDVKVEKVSPSLDHSLYYPLFDTGAKGTAPITVTAMVRPQTPRRAAADTMRVLRNVKNELEERVRVTIFGCESDDPLFLNLPRNFAFDNRGTLMREGVAELLRETDIFVDASVYQAFGRTGLEAMACGCATVLPGNCGTAEYAVDHQNALLVDTDDFKEIARAVKSLIYDENLRREVSDAAMLTAAKYSLRRAAISELTMLRQELQKRIRAGEKTSSLDSVE